MKNGNDPRYSRAFNRMSATKHGIVAVGFVAATLSVLTRPFTRPSAQSVTFEVDEVVAPLDGTFRWRGGNNSRTRGPATQTTDTVFRDCDVCPEVVVVPPGSFMMGSPYRYGFDFVEGPRHWVTIGYALAVGVYEVTFAEWDACVAAGGCGGYRAPDIWGRGRHPVINVSWEDAQAYVAWLSEKTGQEYRLLSEAEWEYVARAGTMTERYKRVDPALPVETSPVGGHLPNAFGLYDMMGNVWEWTEDCWNRSYAGAPADGRAWRSGDCGQRVLRGGSFVRRFDLLQPANRSRGSAGSLPRIRAMSTVNRAMNRINITRGFRVARTLN